jgi:sugar-specific transcriptional regulator TrmB
VLDALGLDEQEDGIYRYLLHTVPATGEEVRTAFGLRPPQARAALDRLEKLGFVYRLPGTPVRFAVASPGKVDDAIAQKLAELRKARESLEQIAARYRAGRLATGGIGDFEVIRGAEVLRERAVDMLSSARSEALNMVKPPVFAMHSRERVRPGAIVQGRLIFDRDAVSDTGTLETLRQFSGARDEIRVHSMVPVKMLAVDRRLALVPLTQHDGMPASVLISESPMLDSFLALFDYVWQAAVQLDVGDGRSQRSAGGRPLPEADRQLLSLLLAGLTDEAIATHFKVSVRTIERKARALMDAAQVRTRMQLGWEAARRGWV